MVGAGTHVIALSICGPTINVYILNFLILLILLWVLRIVSGITIHHIDQRGVKKLFDCSAVTSKTVVYSNAIDVLHTPDLRNKL